MGSHVYSWLPGWILGLLAEGSLLPCDLVICVTQDPSGASIRGVFKNVIVHEVSGLLS